MTHTQKEDNEEKNKIKIPLFSSNRIVFIDGRGAFLLERLLVSYEVAIGSWYRHPRVAWRGLGSGINSKAIIVECVILRIEEKRVHVCILHVACQGIVHVGLAHA